MSPLIYASALAAAVGGAAALYYRAEAADANAEVDRVRRELSEKITEVERRNLELTEAYRAKETKWRADIAKVESDGQEAQAVAAADRDRVARDNDRLQRTTNLALDSLKRSAATRTPAVAAECAPAEEAARVFADLFGRARERAGVLAGFADAAHAAAETCVRADAVGR